MTERQEDQPAVERLREKNSRAAEADRLLGDDFPGPLGWRIALAESMGDPGIEIGCTQHGPAPEEAECAEEASWPTRIPHPPAREASFPTPEEARRAEDGGPNLGAIAGVLIVLFLGGAGFVAVAKAVAGWLS